MKENKELQKLYHKVGFTGTMVSSVLLGASIPQIDQVPKMTLGILSLSFITSNMCLIKDYKIRRLKEEKGIQKSKNRVEKRKKV